MCGGGGEGEGGRGRGIISMSFDIHNPSFHFHHCLCDIKFATKVVVNALEWVVLFNLLFFPGNK